MAKYVNVNQDDLRIQFTYSEDLSGYSGVIYVYRKDDGIAGASSGTATVSPGTGTSLVYYDVTTGDTIIGSSGVWIFYAEIDDGDGRKRATEPQELYIFVKGVPK